MPTYNDITEGLLRKAQYYGTGNPPDVSYQTAHGFTIGDVIRMVDNLDGTYTFYKAQADTLTNATAVGVVSEVLSANKFKYISDGYILATDTFTFIIGTYYYLSPVNAGKMVTSPTYEEYEIEQAIGFGTDKGFKVEIDSRNLDFKSIVEKSTPPAGFPIYMHVENADVSDSDSYVDSDSGHDPDDFDKALLTPPNDAMYYYSQIIRVSISPVRIKAFITDVGVPNTTLIPAGGWFFETYLRSTAQSVTSCKIVVSKYSSLGVITELFNFYETINAPNTIEKHESCKAQDAFVLVKGDRLLFEYLAYSTMEPPATVRLYVEGTATCTNVKIPLFDDLLKLVCEDNYVNGMTFDDSSRILTLQRTGSLPDLTVEIPGGNAAVIEVQEFDYDDIESGVEQTYPLFTKAKFNCIILGVVVKGDATMTDLTIEINGNPVAFGSNFSVDVTTSIQDFEATDDNVVVGGPNFDDAGDLVELHTSGTDGGATSLHGCIYYQRT